MSTPSSPPPPRSSHERLDAYRVAREALAQGEAIAQALPKGYAGLTDYSYYTALSGSWIACRLPRPCPRPGP
ncbi:MAG: hypothetical protein JWP44_4304 [Mucilaginibacter sp.]|nr:hypothetical protein [Mucilaginibacter sp.]